MPRQLLIDYLDRQYAAYNRQSHAVAYTAPEIAENSHITGHQFAKVVMIKLGVELAMVVIPAHDHLDLELLKTELGVSSLQLADEREFSHRFPRCEIGAMPPFGHLFGLQTFIVPVFSGEEEIAFNAGSHTEVIRMPLQEYMRLAYATEVDKRVLISSEIKTEPSSALA